MHPGFCARKANTLLTEPYPQPSSLKIFLIGVILPQFEFMMILNIQFPGWKSILLEIIITIHWFVSSLLGSLCRTLSCVHVFRQAFNSPSFSQVISLIQWSVQLTNIDSSRQPGWEMSLTHPCGGF